MTCVSRMTWQIICTPCVPWLPSFFRSSTSYFFSSFPFFCSLLYRVQCARFVFVAVLLWFPQARCIVSANLLSESHPAHIIFETKFDLSRLSCSITNKMVSRVLMGVWATLSFCLLVAGAVSLALSIVWRRPNILMNMVLSTADLTGVFIERGY